MDQRLVFRVFFELRAYVSNINLGSHNHNCNKKSTNKDEYWLAPKHDCRKAWKFQQEIVVDDFDELLDINGYQLAQHDIINASSIGLLDLIRVSLIKWDQRKLLWGH